ncbi:MAG: lipid II:glycine glycyltransferase FemX [Syntrophales bacterium]
MICITNPIEHENWNNLILALPHYSFFHTSNWAEVLSASYGYRPLYLMEGSERNISALLPLMEVDSFLTGRRGVSLPFSDYCEPLTSESGQFPALFSFAINYGRKHGWKYLELRSAQPLLEKEELSVSYLGHTLELTGGTDNIFSNLRDSTKRNIKKAEKENVKIEITNSLQALNEFYRLNSLTRRDHGLPPQPYHFFKNIYDQIIAKHAGFISLATYANAAIAGNVYLLLGEKVIYKYGASDRLYQHLRANNLVMWQAIKWCCENGYKHLCFGRTETDNDGLRQFKSGWGTKEHIIKYYKYDFSKDSFVKDPPKVSDFQHKVFNKLPISILNALGTLLYRHMG